MRSWPRVIERQPDLFNYDALTPTTRDIVQRRTGEIQDLMRRSAADIVDIGLKLTEVKGILGHGNYGLWLESEFGWSSSAALKFTQVADQFKSVNFTNLEIAPSALYALAMPSTPGPIREEFTRRAEAGEKVTHSAVRTRLDSHREQFKPLPASAPSVITLEAELVQDCCTKSKLTSDLSEPAPEAVATRHDLAALVAPDPEHVIQRPAFIQELEQIGYEDASKLENVLARAIAALTALSTYAPSDLSRIAGSGAGQSFQIANRLTRVRELCAALPEKRTVTV